MEFFTEYILPFFGGLAIGYIVMTIILKLIERR